MMRICYLVGEYVSHRRAAAGLSKALTRAGAQLVVEPAAADVVVLHDEIPAFESYFARYPALRDRYVVGYSVWEDHHVSEARRSSLAMLDEVWTPSRFTTSILSQVHDNVVRVPHVVERLSPSADSVTTCRRKIGFNSRCCYFYAITRPGDPRKNVAALLDAFDAVHRQHPEARLVVKQYGPIDRRIGELAGVVSIEDTLTRSAIAALHAVCHVYVSPHRAEGWGLSIADAMASGNAVVATDYSGSQDLLSEHDGYPVPYTLVAATADDCRKMPGLWGPETRWAEIDPDALVAAMEAAFDNRADDDRRWRATAIVARYGIERVARRLRDALTAIETRRRERPARERRAVPRERPVVGLFHRPEPERDVILGRMHAVDALIAGYAQHGRACDYAVFAPHRWVEQADAELRGRGPWMTVHSRRGLDVRLATTPVDVWHDAQLNTSVPFEMRKQASGHFPVTILHHTISYRHLIGSRWLPFLLARPEPYDSMICSSNAAAAAMKKLLSRVATEFEAAHQVDIHYRGRLDVIPLGVDTSRFAPGDPRPARERFNIATDAFVFLWVGRLSAIDKADLLPLVQAFAELNQEHPKLVLVCCGTERKGDTLGNAIVDYARALGVSDGVRVLTDVREHLADLYRAADVFVSPSDNLQESFGLAAIEAMASGVPQVCSDWNGYRDTVVHEETGLLVPTYWAAIDDAINTCVSTASWHHDHLLLSQAVAVDVRQLIGSLRRLIVDTPLRQSMGRASRKRAVEQYDWRHIVAAHEKLWVELIAQAREQPAPTAKLDYLRPSYAEAFSHYPTRLLPNDAQLRITAHGRRVARAEIDAPTHHDKVWSYLDHELLRRLVTALHASPAGVSAQQLSLQHELSSTEVQRHLMWLLKYDIVELT